jgi:hypothetical protein
MSKDFQRIETGVNLVIGKPLTWLSFLIWLACCWCFAMACRFGSWLRQSWAKRKAHTKPASRGKPALSSKGLASPQST